MLSAADAFTLSSDSEGLPLVLLQAAAAGLPIIATNVGGNGEVVIDGSNGRLIKAGDPDLFALAMRGVLALSQGERKSMGDAGRVRVESMFQTTRVVDRWEQLYSQLLEQTRCEDSYQPQRWAGAVAAEASGGLPAWSTGGRFRTGES
jgi:glycosyltransferase involved in cell wall biosynthesis